MRGRGLDKISRVKEVAINERSSSINLGRLV